MDRENDRNSFRNQDVTNYISNTAKIGNNVKIWYFSYIGNDTQVGDNVMIGSLTHIDYKVRIGEDTRIENVCS